MKPNPAFELVEATASPTGIPRHAYETPIFKVRDGADGALGHLAAHRRRDRVVRGRSARFETTASSPPGVRFQIGLPFPSSALNALKVDFAADYAAAEPALEDLVRRELERLTSEIPPAELAIQWDVCYEVQDIEGVVAWMGGGDAAWERFTGPVGRLARLVPDEVLMGYHFCYGTFPEWPMYEARDMGLMVRMANHAVAGSGRAGRLGAPRRAPLPAQRGQALLRAACRSATSPTRASTWASSSRWTAFPALKRRYETASKYLDEFGVAMYCGFGRQPGEDGRETMRQHRETALAVRELRSAHR